jgi:TonB family protein
MNKRLSLNIGAICLLISQSLFGQDTLRSWISSSGKEIEQHAASMHRKVWQKDDAWRVNNYYLDNTLQMEGSYQSADLEIKEGDFTHYFKNGQTQKEYQTKDNYKVGLYTEWFRDGTLNNTGIYADGYTLSKRAEINRSLPEVAIYVLDTLSLKDSVWTYYHVNGQMSAKETYENGKMVSAEYWDDDGSESGIYSPTERMPEYPGGEMALMQFLGQNIQYPEHDKNEEIQGTVYVLFTVDMEGKVKDAKIERSISPGLDEESLRVVNLMPDWSPGMMQNRLVEVGYNLPIRFSMKYGQAKKKRKK